MSPEPAIGIDSFSYHRWFGDVGPWEPPLEVRWTTNDFLDRAEALGVGIVSLRTVYLGAMDAKAMPRLADALAGRGLMAVLAWGHRNRARVRHEIRPGRTRARLPRSNGGAWHRPRPHRMRRPECLGDARRGEDPPPRFPVGRAGRSCSQTRCGTGGREPRRPPDRRPRRPGRPCGSRRTGHLLRPRQRGPSWRRPPRGRRDGRPYTRMVHVKDLSIQAGSVHDPAAWWPTVPVGHGDLPVEEALTLTLASLHDARWFIEMANMHPDHPDEDAAVAQSIDYLGRLTTPAAAA